MCGGMASPPMETTGSEGGIRNSFTAVRPAAPMRNLPRPDGGGKVLHLMAQDATSTGNWQGQITVVSSRSPSVSNHAMCVQVSSNAWKAPPTLATVILVPRTSNARMRTPSLAESFPSVRHPAGLIRPRSSNVGSNSRES
jgi:hypothetical protein